MSVSLILEPAAELRDFLYLSLDSIPVGKDEVFTCISEDGAMKFYS